MEIASDRTGDRVRLSLDGELDIATAPNLEYALQGAESEGLSLLIVDLSPLRFMDCTGLHVILAAHERAAGANRRLFLIGGPPAVQRVFELTGTDKTLEFLEDPAGRAPGSRPSTPSLFQPVPAHPGQRSGGLTGM